MKTCATVLPPTFTIKTKTYSDSETDYSSSSFAIKTTPKSPITDIDFLNESTDYTQSESESNDTSTTNNKYDHDYPWSTSSDDSFANLSETEVYEKLKAKFSPQEQKINASKTRNSINIKIEPTLDSRNENENETDNKDNEDSMDYGKYFEGFHGRFTTFIIHTTPVALSNGNINEIEYVSEYEGDNEDEDEGEDDSNDLNDLNIMYKHKQLNFRLIQSTCDSLDYDLIGCNL